MPPGAPITVRFDTHYPLTNHCMGRCVRDRNLADSPADYLLNRNEWNHVPVVIHLHGPLIMFAETMHWPDKHTEPYRTGIETEGTALRLAWWRNTWTRRR